MVIEVTFKGNRREFFEWPFEDAPAALTAVVVEAERGEDLGRVHSTGERALVRRAGTTHGKASPDPLRKAIRAATGEEITRAAHLRDEEVNVRTRAIEKVRTLGLDLKVSDTEWQWDKKRLTVFFTAEERVDFRQLVRQLEGLFGTRVHMWHIGVRDEAKRVDGVGRCGRQMCSASWLPELVPVKSSVAKDQHLSTLNPAQISGVCGRLMCCLRYEHEFYVQQRKRFPKEGKIVTTSLGEEKVASLDIFRETVTLRVPGGESRVVPLDQLRQEMGGTWVAPTPEPEDDSDEEERDIPLSPRPQQRRPPQSRPEPQRPPQRQPEQQGRPPQQRPQRPQQPQQPRQREDRPPQERQPQERQQQVRQHPARQAGPPRPPQRGPQHSPPQAPPNQDAVPGAVPGAEGALPADGQASRRRRRGRRGGRRGNRGPGGPPNASPGGDAGQPGNE